MADTFLEIRKYLGVTNVSQAVQFLHPVSGNPMRMGHLALVNLGTVSIWFRLDGVAAVAADADGRSQLSPGGTWESKEANFTTITAIAAVAGPTSLQIVARQAPQ